VTVGLRGRLEPLDGDRRAATRMAAGHQLIMPRPAHSSCRIATAARLSPMPAMTGSATRPEGSR
jgi:hypothetical protein